MLTEELNVKEKKKKKHFNISTCIQMNKIEKQ